VSTAGTCQRRVHDEVEWFALEGCVSTEINVCVCYPHTLQAEDMNCMWAIKVMFKSDAYKYYWHPPNTLLVLLHTVDFFFKKIK
jgi:hypothetical protein